MADWFADRTARHIWETRYRATDLRGRTEPGIEASWRRIARAVASVEPRDRAHFERAFYRLLEGFAFLPGGRIQAGAGTRRHVTLFNCFVMGTIDDSIDGIFDALKEGAVTMQQGGGVGYDFSTLRPRGWTAKRTGAIASGPVSFMHLWETACRELLSTSTRRGAMMATLRCDHPDIERFIEAKRGGGVLEHFNLSIAITDAFMRAVAADAEWRLRFPPHARSNSASRRVRARDLWRAVATSAHASAEPGVLFIDRINHANNLWYCERIAATNPCGEIPLPPYGACDLGSLNLTRFVVAPFTPQARMDLDALADAATLATRFLDDIIELSRYPLGMQAERARSARRIGLGITGLADTLIMLGLHYGAPEAREAAGHIMATISEAAYAASIELAKEKGSFALLDRDKHLRGPFIRALPAGLRRAIGNQGIRNSHLTAIAPTGTVSLLANNISAGIEPVFAWRYLRDVRDTDGELREHAQEDAAHRLWRERHPDALPDYFVTGPELAPEAHLQMAATLQRHVDNAISKTINLPAATSAEAVEEMFTLAYASGLKGCTVFRPHTPTGEVMKSDDRARPCCDVAREPD